MNGLALCAGIGGLEFGLRRALPDYRCVGYVERDAYAAATLVARMEDASLDRTPVWDSLESFPSFMFRGRVDLISAGFPCQPFSVAGKQLGIEDERWLWPAIGTVIRKVGPRLVFLENVPGLALHGLEYVLGTLAELGFDAEWDVFSAGAVGAPHLRRRLFILAWRVPDPFGSGLRKEPRRGRGSGDRAGTPLDRDTGEDLVQSDSRRFQGGRSEPAHANPWPPGPSDHQGWEAYLAAGGSRPGVRRGADGTAYRMDRLRCLGNAVVPAQAEYAFRALAERGGLVP